MARSPNASVPTPLLCGPFALTKGNDGCAIRAPLYPAPEWENTPEATEQLSKAEAALLKKVESGVLPQGTHLAASSDPQIKTVVVPYGSWAEAESNKHRVKDTVLTAMGATEQKGMIIPHFQNPRN